MSIAHSAFGIILFVSCAFEVIFNDPLSAGFRSHQGRRFLLFNNSALHVHFLFGLDFGDRLDAIELSLGDDGDLLGLGGLSLLPQASAAVSCYGFGTESQGFQIPTNCGVCEIRRTIGT